MRVELIPLEGGEPVRLVNAVSVIGRQQQTCNVCLPQSGVSKRHCVIRQTESTVLLRDLGSTNGTRINRERVREEQELHSDDIVALGNSEFRVHIDFEADPVDDGTSAAGNDASTAPQQDAKGSSAETSESDGQSETTDDEKAVHAKEPPIEEPQETEGESPPIDEGPHSDEEADVEDDAAPTVDEEHQATEDQAAAATSNSQGPHDDEQADTAVADGSASIPKSRTAVSHAESSKKHSRDKSRRRGAKQRAGRRGDRISEAQVLRILNEGGGDRADPQLPQLHVQHEPRESPAEPATDPSPEPPPPPPKPESALLRRKVVAPVAEESPQSATGAAANEVLGADRATQARRLLVEKEEPAPERRSLREFLEPVLKDRFTIVAVAAAVVVLLVLWPWGSSGAEYYEAYQTIWSELKELRQKNASQQEWQEFRQQKRAALEPMIKELSSSARSNKPLLQELLFAGRDCLLRMLDDAQTEESESERAFIEHMQLARRMMDSGDPERIYREWMREQQQQRQREAQANEAAGENEDES